MGQLMDVIKKEGIAEIILGESKNFKGQDNVVMPEISGFDACFKIKEMFQPHPPPVIVMTGKLDAIDPIKARKMGADDFVVKTSDMAVLIQAVKRILP